MSPNRQIGFVCLFMLAAVMGIMFLLPMMSGRKSSFSSSSSSQPSRSSSSSSSSSSSIEARATAPSVAAKVPAMAGDQKQTKRSNNKINKKKRNADDDKSAADDFALGDDAQQQKNFILAVPFSSRRARARAWRRVEREHRPSEAEAVISQHNAICVDPAKSIRFDELRDTFLKRPRAFAGQLGRGIGNLDVLPLYRTTQFVILSGFGSKADAAASPPRSAGFGRIFLAVIDRHSKRRICDRGAVIEASLRSQGDMIDVDLVMQVRSAAAGLYEIQPFFRRSGFYTLCLALRQLKPLSAWQLDAEALSRAAETRDWALPEPKMREWQRLDRRHTPPPFCAFQAWEDRQCFQEDVRELLGEQQLAEVFTAMRRRSGRCGSLRRPDGGNGNVSAATERQLKKLAGAAFRSGAWMRLQTCDGDRCVIVSPSSSSSSSTPLSAVFPSQQVTRERASGDDVGGWWVFVSDLCTLRLYSRHDAWSVLNRHWVLWHGGSTLKQPAANLLEYVLGVSVFPQAGMENLDSQPRRRRVGFFSYRQYDFVRERPAAKKAAEGSVEEAMTFSASPTPGPTAPFLRTTMCWGGCPSVAAPPNCGAATGMGNRNCVERALTAPLVAASNAEAATSDFDGDSADNNNVDTKNSNSSNRSDDSQTKKTKQTRNKKKKRRLRNVPSVIVANHFIWRHPLTNASRTLEQVDDYLSWLQRAVADRLADTLSSSSLKCNAATMPMKKRPLLVWIGGVRRGYADDGDSDRCLEDNEANFDKILLFRLDAYFERFRDRYWALKGGDDDDDGESETRGSALLTKPCKRFPFRDVVYISRYDLTSPLHTGSEFAHFGVHYGSTVGMCLTGIGRAQRYELFRCHRNTTADWNLIHMLLNAIDSS